MGRLTTLALAVMIMGAPGGVAQAADIFVDLNSGNGYSYTTIGAAITAAVNGDTIIVRPGTYDERINMSGKAITLRSTDPTNPVVVTSTIIDGGGAGSVITCDSGEGNDTVIEGFFITNGTGTELAGNYYGGGMHNYNNSSPTVNNCTLIGNTAGYGSGMYNDNDSSPAVSNCTFSGNTANRFGGGMCNSNCSPAVINCTFNGNLITGAGGIGAGMCNLASSPTVSNCTFTENLARGINNFGGGMYNGDSSPVVSNCMFNGNTASNGGGGMQNMGSSPVVSNCTFSGNTANGDGGGMCNLYNSSPTVSNCIMWGDTAVSGNETYNDSSGPDFMYCDIQGSGGSSGWDDSLGTDGGWNIDTDPLFVNAAGGDYFLKSQGGNFTLNPIPFGPSVLEVFSLVTSPCIDAGNPASDVGEELAGNGGRINMGVYGGTRMASRTSYVEPIEGDVDGDGDVDMADLAVLAENWLEGV